jgi:hypothetical protein
MSKLSQLTALTGVNLANSDELYVVDVGSPNVSKKITANELAQGSQFSSRYQAIAGDSLWIPANAWGLWTGSPTLGNNGPGAWPGWKLDASTDEGIATTAWFPSSWTTFHMDVYWTNDGAGSGDVRFTSYRLRFGSGDSINNLGISAGSTHTADIEDDIVISRVITSASDAWSNPGDPWWLAILRDADNAADTLANDIAIIGVLLVRAS